MRLHRTLLRKSFSSPSQVASLLTAFAQIRE
jgi:hypothetical protein